MQWVSNWHCVQWLICMASIAFWALDSNPFESVGLFCVLLELCCRFVLWYILANLDYKNKCLSEYTPTLILQTCLKDTRKVSILWTCLQAKIVQILCCKKVCVTSYSFKSLPFVPTVSGTTVEPLSEKED